MSSFIERKMLKIILPAFALAFALGAGYVALSRTSFGAPIVVSEVNSALAEMGYSISVKGFSGNPITGLWGDAPSISHNGAIIAAADKITMRLSVPSLLSGSPKLAMMGFDGLRADYGVISKHMPAKKEGDTSPPALDSISITSSSLRTPWGDVGVEELDISIGDDEYAVRFDGKFDDVPVYIEADIAGSENMKFSGSLKFADMRAEASGELSSSASLKIHANSIDAQKLAEIFPQLGGLPVDGLFDLDADISSADKISAAAAISSGSGTFENKGKAVPYNSFKCGILYSDDVISFDGLNVSAYGANIEGSAVIDMSSPGNIYVRTAKFDLRNIDTRLLSDDFAVLGDFPGIVDFASCDLSGAPDSLSGNVRVAAESLSVYGAAAHNSSVDISISKSSKLRLAFSSEVFNAGLKGGGDISISPDFGININVDAPAFSLAGIAQNYPDMAKYGIKGAGSGLFRISGGSSVKISGNVKLSDIAVSGDYKSEGAAFEFDYANGTLDIKNASAIFEGSEIKLGSARIPVNSKDEPLDIRGTLSGFKLSSLKKQVSAIKDHNIEGILAAQYAVTGKTSSPSASFEIKSPRVTAAGKFKLSLSDVAAKGSYNTSSGVMEISGMSANLAKAKISASGRVKPPNEKLPLSYDVKGAFENIDTAIIKDLGLMSEDISGTVSGGFSLSNHSRADIVRVDFKDGDIIYNKRLKLADITGSVETDGSSVKLSSLRAYSMTFGDMTLGGTIGNIGGRGKKGGVSSDDIDLHISLAVKSADIGRVSRMIKPDIKGYQGLLTGSADIEGTAARPKFKAGAALSDMRAWGLYVSLITIDGASGSMEEVRLPNINARVGRGSVNANARLEKKGASWEGDFHAEGKGVDIRRLTVQLDRETRRAITGALDFSFNAKINSGDISGDGRAQVPSLNMMGLKLSSIEAPFFVRDGWVMVNNAKAKAYGGELTARGAKNLRSSNWGGLIEVKSASLAPALLDALPEMDGIIAGSFDLVIGMGGDTQKTALQDGGGSLTIKNGSIKGFSWMSSMSKIIGDRPIRFDRFFAPFTLDGHTVYLLPGTRVSAPKSDAVFNYVMANGSFSLDRDVNLECMGHVNIRALNGFVGGLSGLASGMIDSGTSGLTVQNFLGGAITGLVRDEFRDVTLNIKGNSEDIGVQNIAITQKTKIDFTPVLNEDEKRREKEDDQIKINVEFPVGPGEAERGNGVGGQIGSQILEKVLKGLVFPK
ncbi:hypothetical protein FACS1894216_06380 [Synergistales bacterium]|nr:hypothetical protein FACS1894216_06380 [Synergistales bacterium]